MTILMLVFVGFVGCQKESTFENLETEAISQSLADIEVLYYTDSKENNTNILFFKDTESFNTTLKQLRLATEQHDENFVEQYKHLDNEALNAKELEVNFDEYKPLKDFNQNLGFNSLLDDYITHEKEWLKGMDLDAETFTIFAITK